MRPFVFALAAAAAASIITLPASPADASYGCVDRNEFRNTRLNTSLLVLEYRYETNGRLESQGGGYKTKSYRACYGGSLARVWISYRHHHDAWRVDTKWYENP